MSSSTRWISRALVAAVAGGLLVLGAAFGAVDAASANDTPPRERPGTLQPEPPTTASPERPARAPRERPGTLAPAEPVSGVPDYTG